METKQYNGWTNYATWRVNLEIFDGYDHEVKDVDAEWCKQYAEDAVIAYRDIDPTSLCASYALAFMFNVNWHEIAESINEIQKQDAEVA